MKTIKTRGRNPKRDHHPKRRRRIKATMQELWTEEATLSLARALPELQRRGLLVSNAAAARR